MMRPHHPTRPLRREKGAEAKSDQRREGRCLKVLRSSEEQGFVFLKAFGLKQGQVGFRLRGFLGARKYEAQRAVHHAVEA